MKRLLWPAIAVLAMASPGCGGSEGGGASATRDSLLTMLHSVPDEPANRTVPLTYGNLGRVRGDERGSSADDDISLLLELSNGSFFLPSVVQAGVTEPDFAKYAGFDTRNITAALQYGSEPDLVAVMVGRFDTGKVKKALKSSPGGDELRTSTVDGLQRFGLGSGHEINPDNRSAIRRIGQGVEIAVDESNLLWTTTTAVLNECLAARAGTTSLADDEDYAAVATALDEAGVQNADLVSRTSGEPWVVAGVGESRDGDRSALTVALQYADEAAAEAAVEAFRTHIEQGQSLRDGRPWSEVVSITDVRSDGALLIATLSTARTGLGHSVLITRDNLLQFG
ncbi:MAG: hypothetical protein Q7V57_06385 [Actinomycetota bacterium]|nr:hypothetical protein [Actinomycetota bacterium]